MSISGEITLRKWVFFMKKWGIIREIRQKWSNVIDFRGTKIYNSL